MIREILAGFVGLSEGIIVGTALIAFITLLDIVPRLAQLTNTGSSIKLYERVIVISVTLVSLASALEISVYLSSVALIIIGFIMGVFIGLLAAALTEVTNVIPIIISKSRLESHVKYIFYSMISGKVIGSLIYWIVISKGD